MFVFLLIFGYVFSFLCLVHERSTARFVFVFLLETGLCFCVWLTRETYCWVCVVFFLETGLCFCVWLTRKGKKILENLGMCSYI